MITKFTVQTRSPVLSMTMKSTTLIRVLRCGGERTLPWREGGAWALLLSCGIVLLASSGCAPSPIEALEDNVRAICTLDRAVCWGEGAVPEAIEDCVDAQSRDARECAESLGSDCLAVYAEFFTCAAEWTCDDYIEFLEFSHEANAPCEDERTNLNTTCPGLSPFYDDDMRGSSACPG